MRPSGKAGDVGTDTDHSTYSYEYEITPDGEFRWLSSSEDLLRIVGFEQSEAAAEGGWKSAVDPADQEAAAAIVARLAAGEDWSGRFRVRAKNGRSVVLDLRNEVEKKSDGTIVVHGGARDVTDEAEMEQALRERESRLRLLMQRIPVVLWSTNIDLCFTTITGSGLSALGLQDDEIVGMSLHEFFGVQDDGFTPISAHLRALEGETVDYEIEWKGRQFVVSVEPLRNEMGVVHGVLGVAVDETDESALGSEIRQIGRDSARSRGEAETTGVAPVPESIQVGALLIDLAAHTITKDGRTINLTPTEFRLVVELAKAPGALRTREDLLQSVWGHTFSGEPALWMTIRRLREKLEDDARRPQLIETVRGLGYRLTAG